ncbi:MAG: alpha/beta fold hydrolase, partial [Burkholderiales bacterium]
MRAKLPRSEGSVERDGVRIHYEVYGEGADTLLFIPPWAIVHSRIYKAQIPWLSDHFRCVTFDPRGNGKSDRPERAEAYAVEQYVADALAVLDATGTEAAILVGLSAGGGLAAMVAALHPARVRAAILIGTTATIGRNYPYLTPKHFRQEREVYEGWDKYNRAYWLRDYPDFAHHFVSNIFTEPHSTKQLEDGLEWAADTTGETLVRTVDARTIAPSFDVGEQMYRSIHCPLLVIHGTDDQIQPFERARLVAEVTGAELVAIEGGGHAPLVRHPARINALIVNFLERRLGIPAPVHPQPDAAPAAARGGARERKALYLSSPIGLGHGRRDIAIARELRKIHSGLEIDWLAQDPVTRLLAANGETIHPISARLANESGHIEEQSGEHDLN